MLGLIIYVFLFFGASEDFRPPDVPVDPDGPPY
jgi:hypothetical protein